MVRSLDHFRKLYETETKLSSIISYTDNNTLLVPSWDYVCWLESRLSTYEKETPSPTTITYTNPLLIALAKSFPTHSFELRGPEMQLYINNKRTTMEWTHPDDASVSFAMHGAMPDQFATAEEYLKDVLLKRVAKYLSSQGENMSMYDQVIKGTTNIDKVSKVVVSLSGGLDSTTLLYLMVKKFGRENVLALSFNYNQRHDIELKQAIKSCEKLGVSHQIIDISFLGDIVKDVSAMVKGTVATPTIGDLVAEKQVPTYVPFRNTILSAITLSFAEANGCDAIALGVQYGDYENSDVYFYWDCSKQFTEAVQAIADLNDKHKITFIAPFVSLTKVDEIQLGQEIGVPYQNTWTCYNPVIEFYDVDYVSEPAGGRNPVNRYKYTPCGVCPSCAGRLDAFKSLAISDPVSSGVIV